MTNQILIKINKNCALHKVIKVGNPELTRLWNLCPDNHKACKSATRLVVVVVVVAVVVKVVVVWRLFLVMIIIYSHNLMTIIITPLLPPYLQTPPPPYCLHYHITTPTINPTTIPLPHHHSNFQRKPADFFEEAISQLDPANGIEDTYKYLQDCKHLPSLFFFLFLFFSLFSFFPSSFFSSFSFFSFSLLYLIFFLTSFSGQ